MNTNGNTIRKGFAAVTAATAFFAITACGTEAAPPSQDIGGTQQQQNEPRSPRTTIPRTDFNDEFGDAEPEQPGKDHDPIDRTKDWH
ncbi:hypothetical protein [Nocardioides sp.]|uniref:hypothetical protein n=1 Tax=Nocardioides sp. TaxID=35761 RepID=UPI0035AECC0A